MFILGVDPGKHTGLALIKVENKKPELEEARVSLDLTCLDWLDLIKKANLLVVENFRVRPMKARKGSFDWSDMETPRVIGSIQTLAAQNEKSMILQEPSVKPAGYGFAQMRYRPGMKNVHIQDACAHAMFYLVKKDLCVPSKLIGRGTSVVPE